MMLATRIHVRLRAEFGEQEVDKGAYFQGEVTVVRVEH